MQYFGKLKQKYNKLRFFSYFTSRPQFGEICFTFTFYFLKRTKSNFSLLAKNEIFTSRRKWTHFLRALIISVLQKFCSAILAMMMMMMAILACSSSRMIMVMIILACSSSPGADVHGSTWDRRIVTIGTKQSEHPHRNHHYIIILTIITYKWFPWIHHFSFHHFNPPHLQMVGRQSQDNTQRPRTLCSLSRKCPSSCWSGWWSWWWSWWWSGWWSWWRGCNR